MHEDVEEEVVGFASHVLDVVCPEVMAAVQSKGPVRIVHIVDNKARIVGYHGSSFRSADFDAPCRVIAIGCKVGACGVANQFAVGIGESVAVSRDIHRPIEVILFVEDGGGKDFFASIEDRGERHA